MNDPRPVQPIRPPQATAPQPVHPAAPHPVPPVHAPSGPKHISGVPVTPIIHADLEPIGLVEEAAPTQAMTDQHGKTIKAFGVTTGGPATHSWKRVPHVSGQGICRVRTFHGRLSDQGMEYLDNTINEWLDAHPDIDVKAVSTTTNMFDGKVKELALIVNIWY